MNLVLFSILLGVMVGAFPRGEHHDHDWAPSGIAGALLVTSLVLLLTGRL